jgi:diguanylate cyclase (GGDEF)-like protein
MDPLTVVAGVAMASAIGAGWHWYGRASRAEAEANLLRGELRAERHAARHDPLTGLPNRRTFYQRGAAIIADPAHHPLAVVLLDLDDFKRVNDEFGHAAGDEVLVTIAQRLAAYAGDNLVARIGGDEFAGLFVNSVGGGSAYPTGQRLAEALAAPMPIAGRSLTITASVGVVPLIGYAADLAGALRDADDAMYRAKRHARSAGRAPTWSEQSSTATTDAGAALTVPAPTMPAPAALTAATVSAGPGSSTPGSAPAGSSTAGSPTAGSPTAASPAPGSATAASPAPGSSTPGSPVDPAAGSTALVSTAAGNGGPARRSRTTQPAPAPRPLPASSRATRPLVDVTNRTPE